MPWEREAGANCTIYQLVTGLGSDKKQLFKTRLLKKGAAGLRAPVELSPGLPTRRGWMSVVSPAGCLPLALGNEALRKQPEEREAAGSDRKFSGSNLCSVASLLCDSG